MKNLVIFAVLILAISAPLAACEKNIEAGGYFWTFHRMNDGNTYHELKLEKVYPAGSSLKLETPCTKYVDAVQVEWDDNRAKMHGELIAHPGTKRLGDRDIDGKRRETWAVHQKTNKIEFEFTGRGNEKCLIKWIRIFYGQNPPPQSGNLRTGNHNLGSSATSGDLPDTIRFKKATRKRACKVLKWNGSKFIIIIEKGKNSKKLQREIDPNLINYIQFSDRWGTATGQNGLSVPFKAKRFTKNMIWFDKKEGDKVISKTDYPIEKFRMIDFIN